MRRMDPRAFICANTKLMPVALVPEIRLHLADAALPIWRATERQLGAANVPPPYWAFAWAGGQALARYLLDNAPVVAARRVLDLGAGGGIAAIAALKAGAAHALAANCVNVATTAKDVLAAAPPNRDLVLVGDLFYERPLATRVLAFIEGALAAGGEVLVGDPRRSYFPVDLFQPVAEYAVPVSRELEDAEIKQTAVWRFAPCGAS
jgi:predicted nicotinamide N-methyase